MSGSKTKRDPGNARTSMNYRLDSAKKRVIVEFGEISRDIRAPNGSNDKKTISSSDSKSCEILSTAELVSSVGKLWDRATHAPFFRPEANLERRDYGKDYLLFDNKRLFIDRRDDGKLSPILQKKMEDVKVNKKMPVLSKGFAHPVFWKLPCSYTSLLSESCKERGLASIGRSYEWMREVVPIGLKQRINFSEAKEKVRIENCISGDRSDSAVNLSDEKAEVRSKFTPLNELSESSDANSVIPSNVRETASICSDSFLGAIQDSEGDGTVSRTEDCSLCADRDSNDRQPFRDINEQPEKKAKGPEQFIIDDEDRADVLSRTNEKPRKVFAKQEHAFAGAFAGVFVSLCLHPVDTVKTVIQSCHTEQKSISSIGRSIVSERGLIGLYRGIASNIASSAPISAVYTFTYESVKGALLPLFPKESHSLAHCLAGGCASIPTSFIFTPSERIKQQMQVGVHYSNCWSALVGIIKNGGLPSLYNGWGAVLCRNIPHSVIKFYTYETLKQMMLASSSTQPNTSQTLVCGGLAGSTAALFTTPFDVVKTRLQTQVPGSFTQYNSVPHALLEISKHEGLKGLYRGLVPRLVMYMSQGAIFFASYEFFKSLLSLDVSI